MHIVLIQHYRGYGGRDGSDGYHVTLTEALSDVKLWRVYRYGYPYSTLEQLGVETEEDAYLATKQAGYWVLRGRTLEELEGYFRAGQSAVAGQKLADIKRRGQKVVDAIYDLVYKAYNSTETPANSDIIAINKNGELKLDSNNNYYSQIYKVTSATQMHSYSITKFSGFPSGSYTADLNGNAKTTFDASEQFKVMIPKTSITNNVTGEITVKSKCRTYPVYFGASSIENYQDYAVTVDSYEDIQKATTLSVDAYKSGINIIKKDAETGTTLSGVTYNIKYSDGTNIGNYTTDKNGKITINNLKQGKIILTETATKNEYELDATPVEVNLEYEQVKTIELTNKHKKGSLKILKVDADNNSVALEGVEFDLIDSNGNVVKHLKTDSKGKAEVSNINIGNYILKETLTNKDYNLTIDQNVTIKWNEALDITIENEKKKGQIKVIKVDADYNETRLEGVEFQVIDKSNKIVETIKTNSKGEATTSKIPIGEYRIKEASLGTNAEYVLNDETKTITVQENKIQTITFENEHKKGNLKIYKVDSDNNKLPVPNVEFEVIDQDGYKYNAKTDENGIAYIENIRTGTVTIRETKTNAIYELSEEIYNAEIKWNETTEITIKNEKIKGKIKVIKVDADYNEIKLEGVEFQIIDKDSKIVETIKTNSNGEAITSRIPIGEYKIKEVSLGSDMEYILNDEIQTITVHKNEIQTVTFENEHKKGNLKIYKVDLDNTNLPVSDVEFEIIDQDGYKYNAKSDENGIAYIENIRSGIATIRETKTNTIYELSEEIYNAEIKWNETTEITINNEKIKGQIEVYKIDAENNEIKLEGVEFQVINSNDEVVEIIKTNSEGYAITSRIPIGEYRLKEIKTDDMHILNENIIKVDVTADTVSRLEVTNERIKGQIKITKTSEDDNFINNKEAGSPIENVKFGVYDSNNNIVDEITTSADGTAITKLLDKGCYFIKELKAGEWYLLNENTFNVEIKEHQEVVEIEITNEAEKPSVDIEKVGLIQTTANQEIKYDFKIKNTGNVPLSDFTWYDYLPTDYVRITKLITGTYNQDLNYDIYYKTNKNEYKMLKDNLNTQVNNYIDFSTLELEADEYITEFKADFGTVDVGFEAVINPYIFVKVNSSVQNDDVFTNKTRIEGYNETYIVWDEDEHTTKVYEKEITVKKLPKTGK